MKFPQMTAGGSSVDPLSSRFRLADLLESGGVGDGWSKQDLADMLRHQLSTPLVMDLPRPSSLDPGPLGQLLPVPADGMETFEDLLRRPLPPIELLVLAKEFAKKADMAPDGPLPPQIATVLYYSAIAAALVRHGSRISQMSVSSLAKGFGWVVAQTWVEESLRTLCGEAASRLDASPDP